MSDGCDEALCPYGILHPSCVGALRHSVRPVSLVLVAVLGVLGLFGRVSTYARLQDACTYLQPCAHHTALLVSNPAAAAYIPSLAS